MTLILSSFYVFIATALLCFVIVHECTQPIAQRLGSLERLTIAVMALLWPFYFSAVAVVYAWTVLKDWMEA